MAGIAPVGGLSTLEFQAAYGARIMAIQKDAVVTAGARSP